MGRSTSLTSGRPDGKVENITTISGQNGLIVFAIPNANKPTYKHSEEVRRNLTQGYVENGVELRDAFVVSPSSYSYNSGAFSRFQFPLGTFKQTEYGDMRLSSTKLGYIKIDGNVYNIVEYRKDEDGIDRLYTDLSYGDLSSVSLTGDAIVSIHKKSPYLATMGTQTHTSIIGDPSPYCLNDAFKVSPDDKDVTIDTNKLVWDKPTSKMYKSKDDSNALDANDGTPNNPFSDTDYWVEVKKGYPQELRNLLASGRGIGFADALLVGE